MKPIIVTYSNESYLIELEETICFAPPARIPEHTLYYCSEIIKGVFRDSIRFFTVKNSDIKLIARQKDKTPVTNY
jgi:hypothetical protein